MLYACLRASFRVQYFPLGAKCSRQLVQTPSGVMWSMQVILSDLALGVNY